MKMTLELWVIRPTILHNKGLNYYFFLHFKQKTARYRIGLNKNKDNIFSMPGNFVGRRVKPSCYSAPEVILAK